MSALKSSRGKSGENVVSALTATAIKAPSSVRQRSISIANTRLSRRAQLIATWVVSGRTAGRVYELTNGGRTYSRVRAYHARRALAQGS